MSENNDSGKSEKQGLPNDKEMNQHLKEYNQETYGEDTSGKEISRANHQAKNDYQDDGEPFGPLSNRDRSTKDDVPSKKE